jgi:hypothetical protein
MGHYRVWYGYLLLCGDYGRLVVLVCAGVRGKMAWGRNRGKAKTVQHDANDRGEENILLQMIRGVC